MTGAGADNVAFNICSKAQKQKGLSMGRWSKQGCIESAREYDDLKVWIQERKTAYLAARNNSWLDECCVHMAKKQKIKRTDDKHLQSSSKYPSRMRSANDARKAFEVAKINKRFEKYCSHMKGQQPLISNESCLRLAISFDSINEFKSSEFLAYNVAKKRGLLPIIKDIIDSRNAKAWIDDKLGELDG